MTNSYLPVKSAIRCLEVLVAVNRLETNATVGEIHRLVNIEKPTIVRMLETLTFLGFLAKDEKTLSYAPTGKTLSLSAGYKKHKLFSALISPLLQEFNRIIGWPVNIGIYDYDSMLIIETKKESGQVSFGRTFEVGIGTRAPMLGSSLGLAYFAFTTQTERNRIISLINKTKKDAWNLITQDLNLLKKKIEQIQKQGYSLMQEDFAKFQYNNRVECIAVPVKYMSTLYGSLNVGFLKTVINTDAAVNKFLPIVKDMANKIGEHVYKNDN